MELNETGLFGIAAISEDLSSAKSLCLGKYQSILETVFRFILNFFFTIQMLLIWLSGKNYDSRDIFAVVVIISFITKLSHMTKSHE